MFGQFTYPRPDPSGTFLEQQQIAKARESYFVARTAAEKARQAALYGDPFSMPGYTAQKALEALSASEVAASEYAPLTTQQRISATRADIPLGGPLVTRTQAADQLARIGWVYGAPEALTYTPAPTYPAETVAMRRKAAEHEFVTEGGYDPTPEWEFGPPPQITPPEFYQGEPIPEVVTVTHETPIVDPREPKDKENKSLIQTLTIVSLVLGIAAFFR